MTWKTRSQRNGDFNPIIQLLQEMVDAYYILHETSALCFQKLQWIIDNSAKSGQRLSLLGRQIKSVRLKIIKVYVIGLHIMHIAFNTKAEFVSLSDVLGGKT